MKMLKKGLSLLLVLMMVVCSCASTVAFAETVNKSALDTAVKAAEEAYPLTDSGKYTEGSWGTYEAALEYAKSIQEKTDATESDVTEAVNGLETAQNGLQSISDKSALDSAVKAAEEAYPLTDSGKYTEGSWGTYEAALEYAKSIQENTDATPDQITKAIADLESAQSGLQLKADKSALDSAVKAAEEAYPVNDSGKYTEGSWGTYEAALEYAKSTQENTDATSDEITKAIADLESAQSGLQFKADKSALDSAVKAAEEAYPVNDSGKYTEGSWGTYEAALEYAKSIQENTDATPDEITKAIADLESAQNGLQPIADKSALQTAIAAAEEAYPVADSGKYTTATWEAFEAALGVAKATYEETDATAEQVTEALAGLEAAQSGLQLKADKAALQTAIAAAKEFSTGTDSSKYTEASWTALQNAIETAQSVYDDSNATAEQVTEALADLEAAQSGLELQSIKDAEDKIDTLPNPGTTETLTPEQKTSIAAAAEQVTGLTLDEKLALDHDKIEKLEELLEKTATLNPITIVTTGILGGQEVQAPTVSNLLLAAGITGGESNKPVVNLGFTQLPQGTNPDAAIVLDLTLTNGGTLVHSLSFPVTVSFTLPSSFDVANHYMVIHHKHDGTVEELPLTISGTTGSFTTTSFSEFEVLSGVNVSGITLDKTTLALTNRTTTGQLTATVLPANAADKTVVWSSSNASVATVDANGKITAKSNGSAVITAKTQSGSYSATCTVSVTGFRSGSSSNGGGSGSSGSITPTPGMTFISDTNMDFSVNGAYQFKITSTNGSAPAFVVGTPGVFTVTLVKTVGNDYYYKITAIGAVGTKAGIYVNGIKLLAATVGASASTVKSDTTRPFNVKAGASYTFKLTANERPTFVAGTSSAFKVEFVKAVGKDYFFRATAIGKVGTASGFYINSQKQPVVAATIVK
ncbi:Ig-like domain-containing protein [Caproiciproducens faecalis]|uniref:FIVAR domain-containing protein n=1 Tax=Caproiciproducens faecalis TaxID=2820301 RepID=A0ABS7DMA0_9FIRM|nr:Ig-like domain-containing protein [Caproiciproducens faecalis]MBW7572412.1 FIVAR domain-containing protein [Caproiciproducens faecalis]